MVKPSAAEKVSEVRMVRFNSAESAETFQTRI